MKKVIILVLFGLNICSISMFSQPDTQYRINIGEQILLRDINQHNLFYYLPGPLTIKRSVEGVPSLKIISLVYTGTRLSENQNQHRYKSFLKAELVVQPMTPQLKQKIMRELPGMAMLKPAPLDRMEFSIIFPGQDSLKNNQELIKTVDGAKSFFHHQILSIPLSNTQTMLLSNALKNNQGMVSLSYAWYVAGQEGNNERNSTNYFVYANTLPLRANLLKFPELIKKINLNMDGISDSYPKVEILCLDFWENNNSNLSSKIIYVSGYQPGSLNLVPEERVIFNSQNKEEIQQWVQFSFAVDTDRPLLYRIKTIDEDGNDEVKPSLKTWFKASSWHSIHIANEVIPHY